MSYALQVLTRQRLLSLGGEELLHTLNASHIGGGREERIVALFGADEVLRDVSVCADCQGIISNVHGHLVCIECLAVDGPSQSIIVILPIKVAYHGRLGLWTRSPIT
jgi:hypothetical protein